MYSLDTDRTQNTSSHSCPVVSCVSVATITKRLWLARCVLAGPFPNKGCLRWLFCLSTDTSENDLCYKACININIVFAKFCPHIVVLLPNSVLSERQFRNASSRLPSLVSTNSNENLLSAPKLMTKDSCSDTQTSSFQVL